MDSGLRNSNTLAVMRHWANLH